MRGRPAKPTKLHVVQGTDRPDRMKKRVREPVPTGAIGDPPSWLQPEAKRVWREIVAGYGEVAVLTILDRQQLMTYCQMFARWVESEKAREYVPLPASFIATMASLGGKLGLNPSDRTRLRTPAPPERDPFDELLGA
jgi:phage terminase small subunit